MPSNVKSNLTIKYGDKVGTWSDSNPTAPINASATSNTAGNIYAAKNSINEIEMYIDTPIDNTHLTTARKRLDPRIYVGTVPEGKRELDIWDNYDVWIDTSGDPTGNATPGNSIANSTSGLMDAQTIFGLSQILNELKTLKIQIVTQSYWNSEDNTNQPRNKNDTTHLTGWLTIVVPDSAGTGYNASTNPNPKTCLLEWDFSEINVAPQNGGSGS